MLILQFENVFCALTEHWKSRNSMAWHWPNAHYCFPIAIFWVVGHTGIKWSPPFSLITVQLQSAYNIAKTDYVKLTYTFFITAKKLNKTYQKQHNFDSNEMFKETSPLISLVTNIYHAIIHLSLSFCLYPLPFVHKVVTHFSHCRVNFTPSFNIGGSELVQTYQ